MRNILRTLVLLLLTVSILQYSQRFVPTIRNVYASVPGYGAAQIIASGQGFPTQIAVGEDGTVYWANQHPFGSGILMKLAPGASSPTEILGGLSYVEGMGIDAAGNVYYDEYMQGVLYELPAGSSTPEVLATGLNYPNFMSVDASGDVYFITGQTCGNTIAEYDATTKAVTTILTAPVLDGVFIHPSGDLYFVTCTNQQIERLPKGSSTPQVIFTWTGSSKPEGTAVDNAGNVFFTVYAESVQVLPAGSSTPNVLATGSVDGFAHQLALDQNDNVFFTDSYAGNVWEIPAEAAAITVTTTVTSTTTVQAVIPTSLHLDADVDHKVALTVTLTGSYYGLIGPIWGQTISVSTSWGGSGFCVTKADGRCQVTLNKPAKGSYSVTVKFAGNSYFSPSMTTKSITVK